MAEYDLTQKLVPHLDRHLAIPLLSHLAETGLFPAEQVVRAQHSLAQGTNMVDYIKSLHDQLPAANGSSTSGGGDGGSTTSPNFDQLKDEATRRYEQLQEQARPVMQVIEDPEAVAKLKSGADRERIVQLLETDYNISVEQINALYHFGQFQFSLGAYGPASNFLYHFLIFSPSPSLAISAHWGKLASNILSGQFEAALLDVKDLRDVIDAQSNALDQLQARTWLLHWSLFVHFNLGENAHLQGLLDMFLLQPAYLNTIQTACPHLLRYVAAAAIVSRRARTTRRDHIRDIVRIIQMEEYQYADPVTAFLKDLFVDFDFASAKERLAVAEQVVRNDFFLSGFADEFVENARWLVSELYCRIHQRIDIGALSSTLNLSLEEGEKWIVNLIRDSPIDAKIDLKRNQLVRSVPSQSNALGDITRGLAFRSQAVQHGIAGGRKRRE